MRILWLSHLIPYPPKGGVLQRAYYLLREVARHHEVDLIAFNQVALIEPLFGSVEEGISEARKELASFCRNVEFVPIQSEQTRYGKYTLAIKSLFTKDPYTTNWLKSPLFKAALNKYLMSNQYDLVHFDTISLIPYFEIVNGIPTVLDHHNIESHMLLRRSGNEKNILKRWYYRQEGKRLENVERDLCPRFSLNITCSDIDGQRLRDISPSSCVEEVPNGVDVDYFRPDKTVQQGQCLIFVGTLSWYPNIEAVRFIAKKLWPKLKSVIPGVTIDIIGANPPDDIHQLGEKDANFRVHGFVDDVRPYMDRAAVYVCPIRDGGGTKLKILDALSMQKAIVAHPIACEGIRVLDGKNVYFAETVSEYIHAINELIDNDDVRQKIGAEARVLAEEEYSVTKIGKKLSSLYMGCVK